MTTDHIELAKSIVDRTFVQYVEQVWDDAARSNKEPECDHKLLRGLLLTLRELDRASELSTYGLG